ncbi:Thiol-disulfide isomerase or thioredoxin [Enhydrobacter aerosaccus]|uniref:Thiol-disulfide isomerase or thioredoxin n=1 Tax=Enhydrobacter aerosaccus TaxID=225324 RepID=A0A1T4JX17_9HYPH|nr:TlpA disulfide reductase family protein [Enhydrobacter aerosaccus]SJZ34746.1 Thiol-disulfide isomerase or thioredoxin [Enhydrobacter aerosaccus]
MAYSPSDFLLGRRLLLAGALSSFALPALADVRAGAPKGSLSRFDLAKAPKPLLDFPFVDAEDEPHKLSDFAGKVLLVNFWATWCAPCVKEMPSLDRLQAQMSKEKFLILPLSLDGPTRAKVAPFYSENKLDHLGVYFDKGKKAMQALQVSVLPTSILIDHIGREIGRLEGEADWSTPEAAAFMKAAVG